MSTQASPKNSTAQKLLRTAQELLQTSGFHDFSFQDLADSAGIRKASVHHHFRNKEALVLQMVENYKERFYKWVDHTQAQNLSSSAQLKAYFSLFAKISSDGKYVCPAAALLLEWNNFSKALQSKVRELMKMHTDWLENLLESAVKKKELSLTKAQIKAHVLMLFTSVQGSLQIARAHEQPQIFLEPLFKRLYETTFATQSK